MKCEKYTACKAAIFQEHCPTCEATAKNKQLQAENNKQAGEIRVLQSELANEQNGHKLVESKLQGELEQHREILDKEIQAREAIINQQSEQIAEQKKTIEKYRKNLKIC